MQRVRTLESSKHVPDIEIAIHHSGERVTPVAHVHVHVWLGRRIDRAVIKPCEVCSALWPTRHPLPATLRYPLGSSLRSTAVSSSREGSHVNHFDRFV